MIVIQLAKNVRAPLPIYTPALLGNGQSRDELVAAYFHQGFPYSDILTALLVSHGFRLSLKTLKRILYRLGLRRRQPLSRETIIYAMEEIKSELERSGQSVGYRAMWKRMQLKGFVVSANTIRVMLKTLDEDGVRERKMRRLKRRDYISPGPNFVWHIDGYDKLKPYGFAIHGAIDGYSRRILWVEMGVSNNNPKVILKYFIQTVSKLGKLPSVIRSDRGTENIHVEDLQKTLRAFHSDEFSNKAFLYGKSSANQRIESWWRILRQQSMGFYINLFKDLVSQGILDTRNDLHIHALRFCFWDIIEEDLERTAIQWNTHRLQVKKNYEGVRGIPDMLYFNAEAYNSCDYGHKCDSAVLDPILCSLEEDDSIHSNHVSDFVSLVNFLFPNWSTPKTVKQALRLYADIVDAITPYL